MEPLQAEDPDGIGPYQLLARLGAGGMGRVYLGRSPSGRLVAVKVLHAGSADEPGFRARFQREVTAARAVSGAFTAAVLDADPDAPAPWLATEFLPGLTLAETVTRHGPLPAETVTALGAMLAEGLAAVHRAGMVHRDLKPSNVLLTPDGPRLIDFGIARPTDGGTITQSGMAVGSPGYMAPEQATQRQTGPAADVFALGAVLAFARTGAGPFGTGPVHAVMYRVLHDPPALDAVTDQGLEELLATCLNKDPNGRPTVDQVLRSLTARLPDGTAPQGLAWLPQAPAADITRTAEQVPQGPLRTAPRWAPAPRPGTSPSGFKRRHLLAIAGAALGTAATAATGISLVSAAAPPFRPGSEEGPDPDFGGAEGLWRHKIPQFDVEVGEGLYVSAGVVLALCTYASRRRYLHALDARTGRPRWRVSFSNMGFAFEGAGDGLVFMRSVAYPESPPAQRTHTLHAIDIGTGKERWKIAPIRSFATGSGFSFIPAGRQIQAIENATGRIVKQVASASVAREAVHAHGSLFVLGDDRLIAYAGPSLETRWEARLPGPSLTVRTPVVGKDAVFVSSDGGLQAFAHGDGRRLWSIDTGAGNAIRSKLASGVWNPTPVGSVLFLPTAGDIVQQLDAKSGRRLAALSVGGGQTAKPEPNPRLLSPVTAAGVAVIFNGVDQLYGIVPGSRQALWQQHVADVTEWDDTYPVASRGRVHLATKKALLSYDPKSGKVVNRVQRLQPSDLTTAGDALYLAETVEHSKKYIRAIRPAPS
ncbi:PQQ-binding-like beta-propeller repeat protein [Actinomadura sp. 9N407]|uniref:protein kinase domain-containing protein n=1 Tax=Actinomadura sp. 9N407 TaxID=3375154 RepID=UPI0037A7D0DD